MLNKEILKKEAMKEIMVFAWEIAANAAAKFGGKKSEYISSAMKLAWKSYKADRMTSDDLEEKLYGFFSRRIQYKDFKVRNWSRGNKYRIYINSPAGSSFIDFEDFGNSYITKYELADDIPAAIADKMSEIMAYYNAICFAQKRKKIA